MKRLTYYVNTGIQDVTLTDGKSVEECLEWKNILDRLAEYEDLEEKGMLLKPPCKVEDSLYIPYSRPRYIKEIKVQNFMYDGCNFHINTDFVTLSIKDIGVTAFLTQEEAEAALQS